MALPRWTGHKDHVWWTSWSRFGRLPVGKSWNQLHPIVVPRPPSPTLVPVNLRNLKYGVTGNDDVKDLQRALNKHNLSPDLPVTGNYFDQTDAAVRRCQKLHGFGLDPVRHSYVGRKQALHLGLKPI
jgi:peptidoglycan hydrolase-like protein with peptidoglycan-binding domain